MKALGRHILVEFNGCNPDVLDDVSIIEKEMTQAAKIAGATVINSSFHHFSPFGVSGVVVIQESHLAIHTWPEFRYAAVDLFTCGESVDPWVSFDHLKKVLEANYSAVEMNRGSLNLIKRSDYRPKSFRNEISPITPTSERNVWFTDKDDNQALSLRYKGDVLFNETTPFQQVRVFESASYGRMLTINNMIMCTERDEFHYHEMIVHPVMQTLSEAKNVLVIGGGDGGTVRELLRYDGVEKVTLVEIDEAVVRASKLHLPSVSCQLSNPKLQIIIGDGVSFVEKAEAKSYDLVIVDGSDPVGPAKGLFSSAFYANIHRSLKDHGAMITQSESPMFHEGAFVELNQCLKEKFGPHRVHTLLFHAPTYPSGMWSLMLATKADIHPLTSTVPEEIDAFAERAGLKYYNSAVHTAAFSLPTFVRRMLNQ